MSKNLEKRQDIMPVEMVMQQINQIQLLMSRAMKTDEHYGVIPGCGVKPSLLKPGAEKLCLMFRLAPTYEIEKTDFEHGHREYKVVCSLTHIQSGLFWGQGVGSCSTMEGKWRYRTKKIETGAPIPKDYRENKGMYRKQGFVAGKNDEDKWTWYKLEKAEHENPADYYNTVLKMGKKRALVDATLTATAASDCFTQDIEEMAESGIIDVDPKKTKEYKKPPPEKKETKKEKSEPDKNYKKLLWETLNGMFNDDMEMVNSKLIQLTAFDSIDKKTGKKTPVKGTDDIDGMSEKRAMIAWHRLSKEIENSEKVDIGSTYAYDRGD